MIRIEVVQSGRLRIMGRVDGRETQGPIVLAGRKLSPSELEVFLWRTRGLDSEEIAQKLGNISVQTVANHLTHIYEKIRRDNSAGGVATVLVEMAVDAVGQGLVCYPDMPSKLAMSSREREVWALAGSGASRTKLKEELFMSEGTVSAHLEKVRLALGVRTKASSGVNIELVGRTAYWMKMRQQRQNGRGPGQEG